MHASPHKTNDPRKAPIISIHIVERFIVSLTHHRFGETTRIGSNMRKTVDVAITSDLICPWCWVGLRKLQEAAKLANVEPHITWKPFLLRPTTPDEGTPKDGTPESRVPTHLKHAGETVGIQFTGLTDRTPNTQLFHATMKLLQDDVKDPTDLALVTKFHEAAFEGYFSLGVFPDRNGLLEAARKVNDPRLIERIDKLYKNDERLAELKQEICKEAVEASRRGVTGVPSFEFNGQPAFSGAQSVEMFTNYLNRYAK